MNLTPTTELDAVNTCLEIIGEQPVNIIPTSGVTEATVAYNVLTRISREIQKKELHCNTEENYPLNANTEGYFVLPKNVLRVDAMDQYLDVVQRGNRLYDKKNHTFTFNQKTMLVEIVFFLPFEELPEHVRHYIAVRAARVFQRNYLGSDLINGMSGEDEQKALINFERDEGLTDDRTFLQTSTPSAVLQRRF